jgi:hypothetical protein
MVEQSNAWLVRVVPKRPLRGVARNDQWLHHRTAAFNFCRLLALGLIRTTSGVGDRLTPPSGPDQPQKLLPDSSATSRQP